MGLFAFWLQKELVGFIPLVRSMVSKLYRSTDFLEGVF